jgi:hypothetical protein
MEFDEELYIMILFGVPSQLDEVINMREIPELLGFGLFSFLEKVQKQKLSNSECFIPSSEL